MAHGGKRVGAGRPKGSTSKPTIFDYWDEEAIVEYFENLRDNYKESDKLMVFVGEQLMGKAKQAVDITSLGQQLGLAPEQRARLDALVDDKR